MAVRCLLALTLLIASASAQDFLRMHDFELVRNRPTGYREMFELQGDVAATKPDTENAAAGQESKVLPRGYVYYHTEGFSKDFTNLDAYAGTDGAYFSIREGGIEESGGRLDIAVRYFPFYREGYYDDSNWLPTGRYEGIDYSAYLGLTAVIERGMIFEVGPFYKGYQFSRNDTTDEATAGGTYIIPDSYNSYGARVYFEQNTLTLDRNTTLPRDGFIVTARADLDFNDQDGLFGSQLYMSSLPEMIVRGIGHLEWYMPTEGAGVWELRLDGAITDKKDRVWQNDAQKTIGYLWGEGRLGPRFDVMGIALRIFVEGQYTKTMNSTGTGSEDNIWFGGGVGARYDLDIITVFAEYSYLTNPNRRNQFWDEDVYGEHQAWAGLQLRFGSRQ